MKLRYLPLMSDPFSRVVDARSADGRILLSGLVVVAPGARP